VKGVVKITIYSFSYLAVGSFFKKRLIYDIFYWFVNSLVALNLTLKL